MNEKQLKELIKYAVLAPSGHNTQPWHFSTGENTIRIFPDFTRRLPIVDPDDHALFISLGCALENLIIAANHFGFAAEVDYLPGDEKEECIRVNLKRKDKSEENELFAMIPKRQSTRRKYSSEKIPYEHLEKLKSAAVEEDVSMMTFTTDTEIQPLIGFVKDGNRLQFNNKAFIDELLAWIRFSKSSALRHKDGLRAPVMGMPSVPRRLGKLIMNLFATPEGEAKKSEKIIHRSAGLLLFIASKNDKETWIKLGRSFQRVALTATALNIKHAHLNMPCEEIGVRKKLQAHLGLTREQPLLLIRIGYGKPMPFSFRRPVEEVLIRE